VFEIPSNVEIGMVEKPKGIRYSVTLRDPFNHGFKKLVERGLCATPQDMIRIALRLLFEKHNIEGFNQLPPEDPRKMISKAIEILEELRGRIQNG